MAKASTNTTTALEFLSAQREGAPPTLVAVFGDEGFLAGEVIRELRTRLCGDSDGLAWREFEDPSCEWRDVQDAVVSVSLFGSESSVAVVRDADKFVSNNRDRLEDFCGRESEGTLVLQVSSWPSNTRLAKAAAGCGLAIDCRVPDRGAERTKFLKELRGWLKKRAKSRRHVTLADSAIDAMVDLLPLSVGLYDQEVARLAVVAASESVPVTTIDGDFVLRHVGGWRARQAWDLIDAAADGDAAEALKQLDLLLMAGDSSIGILAQASASLRRLATATQLFQQAESQGRRASLREAVQRAGTPPFALDKAERQLKQIGRDRGARLAGWLLEADLAMKDHSSKPHQARIVLERLLVQLSKQADARAAGRR
ncbi:DNA polymerase III subunit delta [Pirellulimonas nuda]|uniref:DNA-directed DNA polymerase n=1 Tax=Pirellulimonas nuda TaxID=2528009 RepID=A0A518DA17_9BACT|nr:hypothetical protein [Pirellulimonas nuda]QDU88330.1 DNA polymerase III subunit delta [Pirellulimonas nuda]